MFRSHCGGNLSPTPQQSQSNRDKPSGNAAAAITVSKR
jgi:hypothetical protein